MNALVYQKFNLGSGFETWTNEKLISVFFLLVKDA
jgi:Na+/H+ antiporter NhaA